MDNLDNILPQQYPMRLIDRIISADKERVICEAVITGDHLFYDQTINGVYHWVGIEMMAQASAVLAYFQAEGALRRKRNGFLMSVRSCTSKKQQFDCDQILTVISQKVMIENPVGVFSGQILDATGQLLSSGRFSAYQPSEDEFERILQGQKTI